MKKTIALLAAAVMLISMSGCGTKDGSGTSVVGEGKKAAEATFRPTADPNATQAPLPTVSATQEAFVDSNDVRAATSEEIPVSETREEFEQSEAAAEYVKYTSGDNKWGILLPADAVPGDEDESGIIFMLNQNPIAVNTMDDPVELRSAEEAKQYFSSLTQVNLNSFTVIYDGDKYAGCCFDYEAPNGAFGFSKYAVKGKTSAAASAINMAGDAALNDTLRDSVNSLVVFE